jgi:hypothetical protein
LDHILDLTDAAQGNFRGYLAGQCEESCLGGRIGNGRAGKLAESFASTK